MSNVGSGSSPTPRTPSGRTYWVRSNLAPSIGGEKPPPSREPTGKRFVEPYRLTDEQRAQLITHLEEKEIGDSESCSLFAAAMEYDLAGCRDLIEAAPDRPARAASLKADAALTELAASAQSLVEQLADLDEATDRRLCQRLEETDRFKRGYSGEYLKALRGELERVTQAVTTFTPSRRATAAPETDLPDNARQFILRAGDAFRDCFEQQPTTEQDSPFVLAVKGIATTTGIRVPTDPGTLSWVLAQDH